MPNPPKLIDQVRDRLRVKHYSIRTEQTYVDWIKRYIFFHDKRHPKDMGAEDVEAFLTHLAVAGKVSASTQNQAKSALLFLYREVLTIQLPWLENITQAKAPKRLFVRTNPFNCWRWSITAHKRRTNTAIGNNDRPLKRGHTAP